MSPIGMPDRPGAERRVAEDALEHEALVAAASTYSAP